jgi:hypothetical protein
MPMKACAWPMLTEIAAIARKIWMAMICMERPDKPEVRP